VTQAEIVQWITAIAAIALVILTAVYAWTTWLAVAESKASRLEASRPALYLAPTLLGVNFPIARLSNIGRGFAQNVSGRLSITVEGETKWAYEWHMATIAPGEYHDFMPLVGDGESGLVAQQLAQERRRFSADLTYQDAAGRPYELKGTADWAEITEHLFGARMLLKDDEAKKIEKHLEDIAKAMSSAVSFSDGLKVITYREQRLRSEDQRRFIERIQEESRAEQSVRASDERNENGAASGGKGLPR